MAPGAKILGVQQRCLGFIDSGLPEGDPLPPLPEGCFALVPLEESAEALVSDSRVPAARHGHLRRERRLPPSRSHPVPRGVRRGIRRRRRSRPVPRGRRAVAAAEAVLLARLLRARIVAFHEALLRRPRVAVGSGSSLGRHADRPGASPPRYRAPTTSQAGPGAARARHPDRPEQPVVRRTVGVQRRSGRPRSTSSRGRWWATGGDRVGRGRRPVRRSTGEGAPRDPRRSHRSGAALAAADPGATTPAGGRPRRGVRQDLAHRARAHPAAGRWQRWCSSAR